MTREDVEEAMKEKWEFERNQEKNLKGELEAWEIIMNAVFVRAFVFQCVQNVVTVFPITSSLPQP